MNEPPDYILPVLYGIEKTILALYEEFPRMVDADVLWCCEKMHDYYKKTAQGKELEDPESPIQRKQDLMDELLNLLEHREEVGVDKNLINNPDYRQGEVVYSSHAMLYAAAIKRIRDSVRFWKKNGKTGYLTFIKRQVI